MDEKLLSPYESNIKDRVDVFPRIGIHQIITSQVEAYMSAAFETDIHRIISTIVEPTFAILCASNVKRRKNCNVVINAENAENL